MDTIAAQSSALFDAVLEGAQAPLLYILDPARRLYWGFLLSSVLMAILAIYLRKRKVSLRDLRRAFFSPAYWFNRSTATDVAYLCLNSVLRVAVLVPLFGSHLWATIVVARFLQANFGNGPELALPLWSILTLYTLAFFIAEDLSRFGLHLALHKIPLLWRFHRVHHSATVLTPLTVHRVHPVEMLLYFLRGTVVFGVVSGCCVYLFGSRLGGWQIVGVDALGFLFNLMGANLRHSHIWLGFGALERWFISPAQHQIHHSARPEHRDKNFGTCLACWDRWLQSCVYSTARRNFRFGIVVQRARPQTPPDAENRWQSAAAPRY